MSKPKQKRSKASRVDSVIDELRKAGATGIYTADQLAKRDVRIPSDIFGLNIITRGGLPYNRITEIWGEPGSFKTTLCMGFAKEAQKIYGDKSVVVWLSNEGRPDVNWARHVGVKIPYSQEEIADLRSFGLTDKEVKEIIDSQKGGGRFVLVQSDSLENGMDSAQSLIETGEISLYVFDSVGAAIAEAVMDQDHGDNHVANEARLITRHTKKLLAMGNRLDNLGHKTAFILVNQVRSVIGTKFPTKGRTGGWGFKHNKSLALSTRITGLLRVKKTNEVWGKMVMITCDKSKVSVPHRSCTILYAVRGDNPMGLEVGPDSATEAAELAKNCGVISYNRSGRMWMFEGEPLQIDGEPVKVEGIADPFRGDPEMLERLKSAVSTYHFGLEITGARYGKKDQETQDDEILPEA